MYTFFFEKLFFKNNKTFNCVSLLFIIYVFLENFKKIYLCNLSDYYNIVKISNNDENMLMLISILVILIFSKNIFKKNIHVFILIITMNSFIFNDNFNNFLKKDYIFENSINENLINGLMLMHPQILIYLYVCIYYVFYKVFCINLKKKKLYKSFRFFFKKVFFKNMFIILLGSIWSNQELLWGGWWSWDLIEIFSISILNLVLINIHFYKKYNNINYCICTVFCINIIIVCTRYNLINSIHNFIPIEEQNQYYIYIYLYVFIHMCIFIIFLKKKNFFNSINITFIYTNLIIVFLIISLFYLNLTNLHLIFIKTFILTFIFNVTLSKNNFFFNSYVFYFLLLYIPYIFLFFYNNIINFIKVFFKKTKKKKNLKFFCLLYQIDFYLVTHLF